MELSSDEKCAIKRECIVKIVKESRKALLFETSKIYGEKFKSGLKEWKEEFINFGAFLKYGASSDNVVVGDTVSSHPSVGPMSGTCMSSLPVQYL